MAEQFISIRNWEKFQHYKKRNPPWIRLYTSLLRDPRFFVLPDETRYHLLGLFLLASQHDNKIPANMQWLQHELATTSTINLKLLQDSEWLTVDSQVASAMLARCEDDASNVQARCPSLQIVQRQIPTIQHASMMLAFGEIPPPPEEAKDPPPPPPGDLDKSAPPDGDDPEDEDAPDDEAPDEEEAPDPYTPEFEENFWQCYPKKTGKGAAYRAWKKLGPSKAKQTQIHTQIQAAKASVDWTRDAGRYIPNPATWLNQRRFDDEIRSTTTTRREFGVHEFL